MGEMIPNFYKPGEIRKMIDPRERAKTAIFDLEVQIQEMLKNEEITKEDIEELLEKVKDQRSTETTH